MQSQIHRVPSLGRLGMGSSSSPARLRQRVVNASASKRDGRDSALLDRPSAPSTPPLSRSSSVKDNLFSRAASAVSERVELPSLQWATVPPTPQQPSSTDSQPEDTLASAVNWDDVNRIMQLAGPLFVQYAIGHISYMVDTAFVGHLSNPVLLSSMVLACSLANATGYSIAHGLSSASDTISGQAYGAGDYKALGATLQRSILVNCMALLPISALWFNAEPILTALGQTPDVAAGAARFLSLTVPALWMYSATDCVEKHLLAQGIVKPGVAITAAKAAFTPAFAWLFINFLGLELDGAAYAYCATTGGAAVMTMAYLFWRSMQTAGAADHVPMKPTMAALQGWGPYLGLALPAVLMTCMEGWAVEVLIFLAGALDNAEVAVGVTGLCLQFSTLVWVTAASIASASGTRIANALGKGDGAEARRTTYTGLAMALATQVGVGLAAYHWRADLVGMMTNQPDVAHQVCQVMPVLALCFIFDGQNAVLGSTLRAAGRQWTGASLNLAGWWCVGVPLAWWLGLHEGYGVAGLWGGFATASGIQAVLQWYVLMNHLDFDKEAERGASLLKSQGGKKKSSSPLSQGSVEQKVPLLPPAGSPELN